jgi:hypothetical protein
MGGTLTGRTRYRLGFNGRIVVQVEEKWFGMPAYSRQVGYNTSWRDAGALDLQQLEPPSVRDEGKDVELDADGENRDDA